MSSVYKVFLTYNGERVTYDELSKRTGIAVATLRNRIIHRGMTPEEAVERPVLPRGEEKITYHGAEMTYYELSQLSGINEATLRDRVKRQHLTPEDATLKKNFSRSKYEPPRRYIYEYLGERLPLAEIAKRLGYNRTTLSHYAYYHRVTQQEAIDHYVRRAIRNGEKV